MLRRRRPHLDTDAHLRAVAEDVRRAHAQAPDEETAARHMTAIVAAAEAMEAAPVNAPAGAAPRRPLRLRRVIAAGALALLGLTAGTSGLAAAGVALPDPVRAPFDAVGVTLPNQASETARERTRTVPAPAVRTRTTPAAQEPRPTRGGPERGRDPQRTTPTRTRTRKRPARTTPRPAAPAARDATPARPKRTRPRPARPAAPSPRARRQGSTPRAPRPDKTAPKRRIERAAPERRTPPRAPSKGEAVTPPTVTQPESGKPKP